MSRLEEIKKSIKELKLYRDYLINLKLYSALQNEDKPKILKRK